MEITHFFISIRQLVERSRKEIKEQIHKYKKRARCNLPELHLYCGVCDLKTGLYIRSIFTVMIYFTIVIINVVILYRLMNSGKCLWTMEISDIEDYLGINFTEINLERVKKIYELLVAYIILWIIFKIGYILAVFLTIYAIYKKKPKILKFVLFVNILNWILDICISIFGAVLTQIMSKLLVITCLLFEGYNLMAISSARKQLKGKSKLLLNINETNSDVTNTTTYRAAGSTQTADITDPPLEFQQHCQTCICNLEPFSSSESETRNTHGTESSFSVNHSLSFTVDEQKSLNIKDIDVIFNQDQLLPRHNSVFENAQCVNEAVVSSGEFQILSKPKTLQLYSHNKDKMDISDIPIIYDKNQLQVGGSPVIEDRQPNQSSFH